MGAGTILWALIPALSLGFLAPVPFAHAAVRLRQRWLWAVTAAYAIGVVALFVFSAAPDGSWGDAVFGTVLVALMLGGTIHAFWLRGRVFSTPPAAPATAAALAASTQRGDAGASATGDAAPAGALRIDHPELPRVLPPGWYPDPAGGRGRRWWDGTQWAGAQWADQVAVPGTTPAKPRQAWPRLLIVIALVVGLGLGAIVWRSLFTRGQTSGPGGLCFPPASAGQSLANQDTDAVYDVAFSPDGKTMATGSCNDTVRLWDVATHRQIGQPLVANHRFVRNVAFSPDGKTLATGGQDAKVRLWDIDRRQQLGQPLVATPNPGPQADFVTDVAFSPDGKTVAAARYDRAVRLWDVASHQQLGQLGGHTGSVDSVAFSADGQTIASAGGDGVRLWDAASHQQLGQPLSVGTDDGVYSVAFSPDGTTLASVGFDRTVRLWDVAGHRQIDQLTGHRGTIYDVAFSPDGTTVASADYNGVVRLWEVASRREIGRLTGHTSRIFSVVFSPDGKTLASASQDHTMRVWDLASHRQIWQEGT